MQHYFDQRHIGEELDVQPFARLTMLCLMSEEICCYSGPALLNVNASSSSALTRAQGEVD